MKRLLLTLFIVASLILPIQGNADITKFGGFLPCTSDNGTLCTTSRYISTPGVTFSTSATFSFLTSGYLPKAGTSGALGNSVIYQDSSANIGLGTATFGTSAAKAVGIPSGTAPTTSPADAAQVWVADHNGQAGYARLHERTEDGKSAPIALLSELETPLAFAQGIRTSYAASGTTGITVANNDNLNMATNNFGYFWRGVLPDYTPSVACTLARKGDPNPGWIFYLMDSGQLRLYINGTNYNSTNVITNYGAVDGKPITLGYKVVRESASTAGTITFYVNGYPFATASITAGAPGTVSNTSSFYIMGNFSEQFEGVTYAANFYNRAPSDSEILLWHIKSIDYADKWGSQTAVLPTNNGFETDTASPPNGWTNAGNQVGTAVADGTAPEGSNVVEVVATGAGAAGTNCVYSNSLLTAYKKYRVKFYAKSISGSTTLYIHENLSSVTITGDWVEYTVEGTIQAGGRTYIYLGGAGTVRVDNIRWYEIGATLALEPEGIQRDAWKDSSTNGLNASYPASGSSPTRQFPLGMETLLSTTTVSFAADADTTLYTVPAGRRCVLTKAILVIGADAGTSVISIGADGAETNWLPNNTLSNLDAANDAAILMPVPNTTPVLVKSYAGGTVIQAKVSSHAGGATNTLYLFGFIY